MADNSGAVHKGEWFLGQKNGYGEVSYSNGDAFKGYFHNDLKHGTGNFTRGPSNHNYVYVEGWLKGGVGENR